VPCVAKVGRFGQWCDERETLHRKRTRALDLLRPSRKAGKTRVSHFVVIALTIAALSACSTESREEQSRVVRIADEKAPGSLRASLGTVAETLGPLRVVTP
jgi:hypothetical protein